jgi:lysine 2,3-aminomutase
MMRALRGASSGYTSRTMLDIPGGHGKAPVGRNYLLQAREADPESRYRVVDYCGDVQLYPPKP